MFMQLREGSHLSGRMNDARDESSLVPCQFERQGERWLCHYDERGTISNDNGTRVATIGEMKGSNRPLISPNAVSRAR